MKFTKLDKKVLKNWNDFHFGYCLHKKSMGLAPIPHDMAFRTSNKGVELFYKFDHLPVIAMSWSYFDKMVKEAACFLSDAGNSSFQIIEKA